MFKKYQKVLIIFVFVMSKLMSNAQKVMSVMSKMMSEMMSKTQLFLYTSWYRLAFLPYSTNLSPFLIFLLQCFLQFGIVQMYLPSWESVPYVRILN